MKEEEKYSLDEVVKKFYETEPLKINLSNAVVNRVFVKKKRSSFVFDKILYFVLSLISMVAVIYCFSLLAKPSMSFVMLFFIPVICIFGLSVKEYSVLSKKVHNFQ
jgi:hypothetical protein